MAKIFNENFIPACRNTVLCDGFIKQFLEPEKQFQ